MHESNRPAACMWRLLLLMTPGSGWEWGGVGVGNTLHPSLRYLDLSGHGPDVNNSFVDTWTLEFIALLVDLLTDWNTGWGPGDRDAKSPGYIPKLWWHVPTV